MIRCTTQVKIPFHDIDILEIVWHGHYYKYLEIARTALMQKVDLDWPVLRENGIAMPVVQSGVKHKNPILYNRVVDITATISTFEYPELVIDYAIYDPASGKLCAQGMTRQIYYDVEKKQSFLQVPDLVKDRLEQWRSNH